MKGYKGARFKVFDSKLAAEKFSMSKNNPSSEKAHHAPVQTVPHTGPAVSASASAPAEGAKEVKVLKVPSFHDTIKFRQHIERASNGLEEVEQCLANPRYLISSCDIPVILQEGSRMNAVHIAIKSNRIKIVKMIFNNLQSEEYLRLVYTNAEDAEINFRRKHLLDLYLNTPEKILCDGPLHMACKFGFIAVAKYLLSFKALKVHATNSEGSTAQQVICDRVHPRSVGDRDRIKAEIQALFQEKAYVPLYENEEDGTPSKIGAPIYTISPNDVYANEKRVKAFVGPMSPDQASKIFQEWKKSPRHRLHSVIALSDYEKGMERIGRSIASNEKVPFTEYWPFLDKYTNLQTPDGLKKLEKYLKSKYTAHIQQNPKNGDSTSSSGKKKKKNGKNRRSVEVPVDQ